MNNVVDQDVIFEHKVPAEPTFEGIYGALQIVCDPGDVHEVRAPGTSLGTIAGWFDDLEAMALAILGLTRGQGTYRTRFGSKELQRPAESVYLTLNPTTTDFLALVDNRVTACDTTTTDNDITAIKRLYLDGDPWRRSGISSTDEGHGLAIARMREIQDYLSGKGYPDGCLPDSGNGGHLVHATLLENTAEDRALVKAYVHSISARFGVPCKHGERGSPPSPAYDDRIIHLDPVVYNPARIVTAYGTMKRKGSSRPERPHRLARILDSPTSLDRVDRALVERVVADLSPKGTTTILLPPGSSTTAPGQGRDEQQGTEDGTDTGFGAVDPDDPRPARSADGLRPSDGFDLRAQLDEMGVLVGEPRASGVFTYFEVVECPFYPEHTKVRLSQHRSGTITFLCPHHSCQGKKEGCERKTARDYFGHYGVVVPEPKEAEDETPKAEKTSRVSLLVRLALRHCTITKDSATEVVNASFPDLRKRITCPVESRAFRQWLVRTFREQTGRVVKSSEVSDAVMNLTSSYTAHVTTYRRITRQDDAIYVDTLDEGRVVRITAGGWEILDACPDGLVFETRKDMGSLPLPRPGGSLDELWEFINVRHEDRETYVCFLLASLAGRKPYPILLGNGQEGSGKTNLTGFTVGLIDPCQQAPAKDVPETRRDLVVQARNRHLIAYDNVSRISGDMSDAFCRLSTGTGFTVRGLYKDDEEMIFGGANPLLFNGIPELGDKSDFLSRSIRVRMPTIPPGRRRTEGELHARWAERRPYILGVLYDLIANGLRHEAGVGHDGKAPRMMDNYQWFRACEAGTGLRLAERFRENYEALIREVAFETLTGKAVLAFLRGWRMAHAGGAPGERDVWRGTMSALYEAIKPRWPEVSDGSVKQRNLLPGSPARLTNAIDAIASSLAANGIIFTRGRSKDQRWAQIDARGYFGSESAEPTGFMDETDQESGSDAPADDDLGSSWEDVGVISSPVLAEGIRQAG